MNKEQVYDAQIAPLMAQIMATCREHGIAMLASFSIPTPENPDLMCTSMLPDGEGKPQPHFFAMGHYLHGSTGHLRKLVREVR